MSIQKTNDWVEMIFYWKFICKHEQLELGYVEESDMIVCGIDILNL